MALPEERLYFLDNLRTFLIFLVVLYHSGLVYESSGFVASFWIVDDPDTSGLPGLLNLVMDIFIMPGIFFISGFFTPSSLERKGAGRFLVSKVRRLMVPWAIAVVTLIPLYKVIFLLSRGMPQEAWTTYFHFSNGIYGMNWLWFLPALFLFELLYLGLSKLHIPIEEPPLGWATALVFLLGMASTVTASVIGWIGWTKTPFIDFQNERLLPYFLVFLLGALCFRQKVFRSDRRPMKLYIALAATAWIPINLYVITLLTFIFRPGQFIVSEVVDMLLLWAGYHLSVLTLLYLAVMTFKFYCNRSRRLLSVLNDLSYGVYIIHLPVLGVVALALLGAGSPAVLKYATVTVATFAASNVLVYAYKRLTSQVPRVPPPASIP